MKKIVKKKTIKKVPQEVQSLRALFDAAACLAENRLRLLDVSRSQAMELASRIRTTVSQNDSLQDSLAGAQDANKILHEEIDGYREQISRKDFAATMVDRTLKSFEEQLAETKTAANNYEMELRAARYEIYDPKGRFEFLQHNTDLLEQDYRKLFQENQALVRDLEQARRPWYRRTIDRIFRKG